MAADERVGQAELAAERAHLVLEQFAQRLDQLHVHALGQAADIVVRLDRDRRAAGERHALDHVGIERALRQEFRAADLLRLRLEHVDEQLADDLALCLRIGDAGERGEEMSPTHRRGPAECCSGRGTARRPARPRPSRSRPWSTNTQVSWSPIASWISTAATDGIDAAGQSADHPALADLRADFLDRLVLEGAHGPVAACSPRSCARNCAAAPRRAACAPPRDGTGWRRTCASRRRSPRTARSATCATTRKPGGSAVTRSPWLIQTG